ELVTQNDSLPKYVSTYQEGEKTYYQVYVNLRSKKHPTTIREQERIKEIGTLKEAMRLRDKCIIELTKLIAEREAKGFTWGEIVAKWDFYWRKYPSRSFNEATLKDHVSRMLNWTELWWKKPAGEISIGDVRTVIKAACDNGASIGLRNQVKQTINLIFKWGLEEKLIPGLDRSPARDVDVLCAGESKPDEKRNEILTSGEISRLLEAAERKEHPWYPVWFVGFHSGLRTSELEGLRKEKVELVPLDVADQLDALPDGDPRKNYGFIHVELAWKNKAKDYGPTKAHYYRSVPVNSELYRFLMSYLPKANFGKDDHGERLFDELPHWKRGGQAKILRLFCEANGLVSIKFHTIRACFATQLLALGTPEDKVMKIGGWKDVETMRIYVRTAGILEHGATEGLKFKGDGRQFDPASPYRNVDYRKATELSDDEDDDEGDEAVAETAAAVVESLPKASPVNVVSMAAFRREKTQ
ncbi:MAG: tyrosine-type recombinase/integrase, partial [Bdellovibrionota bacterium]